MHKKPNRVQTIREEKINTLIHGLGILFVILSSPFLILKARMFSVSMIVAVSVYAFGMLAVYSSSTIYHALQTPHLKVKANIIDHISIYLLIGGTYTPLIIHYTRPETALIFLTVQWSIILAGAILKLFFTGKYEIVSVGLYMTLGWMIIFVIKQVLHNMPPVIFNWIIAGGISYSVGIIFYRRHQAYYAHNIWHCFVLAGTIFHFIGIYKSLDQII